jgi:hypothetical protein
MKTDSIGTRLEQEQERLMEAAVINNLRFTEAHAIVDMLDSGNEISYIATTELHPFLVFNNLAELIDFLQTD